MDTINAGVDFNFSFAPEVTDQQILGFELAGEMWSQALVDTYNSKNLEINIHVEIRDDLLPDNIIGAAFPTIETGVHYKDFYSAIQNDVTTGTDQTVADSLLDEKKIDLLVGENVIDNNFKMHFTRANMKALGLVPGDSEQLDGYIIINSLENISSVSWDYDYLGEAKPAFLTNTAIAVTRSLTKSRFDPDVCSITLNNSLLFKFQSVSKLIKGWRKSNLFGIK